MTPPPNTQSGCEGQKGSTLANKLLVSTVFTHELPSQNREPIIAFRLVCTQSVLTQASQPLGSVSHCSLWLDTWAGTGEWTNGPHWFTHFLLLKKRKLIDLWTKTVSHSKNRDIMATLVCQGVRGVLRAVCGVPTNRGRTLPSKLCEKKTYFHWCQLIW